MFSIRIRNASQRWLYVTVFPHCIYFRNEPAHDKTYKMACAPSKGSDQPGHLPSLIWVFAVRMKKAWVLSDQLTHWDMVRYLLKYKAYNNQTLHSASPQCTDSRIFDPVTLTYIQRCSDFDTFYIDVRYRLNYKAYNHQTLLSASPQCTGFAGSLIWWPWPIFRAPRTLTHFTSTFDSFSTLRPTTTKPCIVLLLDVLTWQVCWPGALDLYFVLQWLWHILRRLSIAPQL